MKPKLCLMTCVILTLAITFTFGMHTPVTATTCDSVFVKQNVLVFIVLPTGTNDTNNMQCAFDSAANAGAGSTIKLLEGTYYIDRRIVAKNFSGSFIGAGKQNTFVQNLDNVPFPHGSDAFPYHLWPDLFVFFQDQNGGLRSITVSDLTFRALGQGEPAYMHGGIVLNGMNILTFFGKITGIRDDELSFFNVTLLRAGFEGQSGDAYWGGYNVINAVVIQGEGAFAPCDGFNCVDYVKPISGNYLIQDCTFTNAVFGPNWTPVQDSNITIKNSTFDNERIPIYTMDLSHSIVDIERNTIHNASWYGIGIWNAQQAVLGWDLGPHGSLPEPSDVFISKNDIAVTETGDGIGIEDYGYVEGKSTFSNVAVSQNKIRLNDTSYGAIYGMGASRLAIINNGITGHGGFGIYSGLWDDPVSSWVIAGNNLQNATTDWPSIILGPSTSSFTVVGGSNSLLDLGTNNVIMGFNATHDADIGQQVRQAMLTRRNLHKLIR